MKELVGVMTKALVEHPEEVAVTEIVKGGETIVELRVAPSDTGKVTGKQEGTAEAIHSIVKAAALRGGEKMVVEI